MLGDGGQALRFGFTALFVLVRPWHPENIGAAARAINVMGATRLAIVDPHRRAMPTHRLARKMAVKSENVLLAAQVFPDLHSALRGSSLVYATSSKSHIGGTVDPHFAAREVVSHTGRGGCSAFVFGNEKTGLTEKERALCTRVIRIPMARQQPSLNLAQAVQIIAYEVFLEVFRVETMDSLGSASIIAMR
jgi:TrmH family RNA methyltransferase